MQGVASVFRTRWGLLFNPGTVPPEPPQGTATVAGSNMSDEAASLPTRFDPVPALVAELGLPAHGIASVIAMLDEGNTVPFVARHRRERTGGLDEVQIRRDLDSSPRAALAGEAA